MSRADKNSESYKAYKASLNKRYAEDEEFREGQKQYSKERYHLITSNTFLHEKYLEKRRERMRLYMQEYRNRQRAEAGLPPVKPRVAKEPKPVRIKKERVVAGSNKPMTIADELQFLKRHTKR